MRPFRGGRHLALWLIPVLVWAAAVPLAGQHRQPRNAPEAALARRTQAFLRAMLNDPDSAAAFFPRQGDWTWVNLTYYDHRRRVLGLHRFRGTDAPRVLNRGGPMCEQMVYTGEVGSELMEAVYLAVNEGRPWKRFRGWRFTPPGRDPAVFVEWRREEGAWVVSALGTTSWQDLRLPGVDIRTAVRDRVPGQPPARRYAEHADWFLNGEPFSYSTLRYVKYGLPRGVPQDSLRRIAVLRDVPVYTEIGSPDPPEVLYVAFGPGLFQPYSGQGIPPCS